LQIVSIGRSCGETIELSSGNSVGRSGSQVNGTDVIVGSQTGWGVPTGLKTSTCADCAVARIWPFGSTRKPYVNAGRLHVFVGAIGREWSQDKLRPIENIETGDHAVGAGRRRRRDARVDAMLLTYRRDLSRCKVAEAMSPAIPNADRA